MENICIRNQFVRQMNILAVLAVTALCFSAHSSTVIWYFIGMGAASLVYLSILALKHQLSLTSDIIICGLISAVAYLNAYRYSFSVPVSILLSILNIPFFIWIFVGLKDGLLLLLSRSELNRIYDAKTIRWVCALVFAFSCMILMSFWIDVWPYGATTDSFNQWNQIHGKIHYSDVHAMGHTILLKLLLEIMDSYRIVIVFQVLCTAAVYTLFAAFFMKNRIPIGLILLGIVLYNWNHAPMSPVAYPWKDLPYSLCVALLTLLMMGDCFSDIHCIGLHGCGRAAAYGALLAGIYLLRLNGILILLFTGAYLIFCYAQGRKFKEIIALVAVCAAMISGINWYGYKVLGFNHAENGFSIAVFGSGLAAAVNDNHITQEELDMVDQYLPVEWMQKHYSLTCPRTVIWDEDDTVEDPETLVYNNHFVVAMGKHPSEVIKLYLKLLPNHWKSYLQNILYSTTSVWGHRTFNFDAFYDNITQVVLIGFALCMLCRKAFRQIWPVLTPVFWNIVSISISAITNEERYLLPTVMLAPFLILFFLVVRINQSKQTV